jgi:hypothetical protein
MMLYEVKAAPRTLLLLGRGDARVVKNSQPQLTECL